MEEQSYILVAEVKKSEDNSLNINQLNELSNESLQKRILFLQSMEDQYSQAYTLEVTPEAKANYKDVLATLQEQIKRAQTALGEQKNKKNKKKSSVNNCKRNDKKKM